MLIKKQLLKADCFELESIRLKKHCDELESRCEDLQRWKDNHQQSHNISPEILMKVQEKEQTILELKSQISLMEEKAR
jgi:hypothetical protein